MHIHIEGSFEPETMLAIAKRNNLTASLDGYDACSPAADGDASAAAAAADADADAADAAWCAAQRAKRNFGNLQEFLDLYYAGCDVLKTEQDFYDLCWAYLERASACAVARAEIFFDPQTHTVERQRLPLATVVNGLHRACVDARTRLAPPVDAALILCFLRHRHPGCAWARPPAPAGEAMALLEAALKDHRAQPVRYFRGSNTAVSDRNAAALAHTAAGPGSLMHFPAPCACISLGGRLLGVGLDSSEAGNPPALFRDVFARAKAAGLRRVAHAGEEGPAAYVAEALDALGAERVDHGVRCLEDPALVRRLAEGQIPLTVCPCSNHRLQARQDFAEHFPHI